MSCKVTILLTGAICNLVFGIVEAVFLSQNLNAKYECGPAIWYCILSCCIMYFVSSSRMFHLARHQNARPNEAIYLIYVIPKIWAAVCYYDTQQYCVDVFNDKYPDMWNLVILETVMMYIDCAVAGFGIYASCCGLISE